MEAKAEWTMKFYFLVIKINHIQKWTLPEEQIIFRKKINPFWPDEDAMNGIEGFKQSFICFVVLLF